MNYPYDGSKVTLAELLPGTMFRFGETVALKSEYETNKGAVNAYILGSGEMFWGGTSKPEEQRTLLVEPIQIAIVNPPRIREPFEIEVGYYCE